MSRISDEAYAEILSWIVSGKLQPGDTVNELAISRDLGVSRTPVHEAVCALEIDGLVVKEGNKRRTIAQFRSADVQDIFEMRLLLESEAARRAARNIDRPTLARLRREATDLLEDMDEKTWLAAWNDFDDRFHTEIANACGSPRLRNDILRYRLLHRALNTLHADAKTLRQALDEHVDLLDALDERDSERAASSMSQHIREWQAYFSRAVAR